MPGALLGWGLSSAAQTTHQALLCAEYSVYILPMQSPGRHGNLARLDRSELLAVVDSHSGSVWASMTKAKGNWDTP